MTPTPEMIEAAAKAVNFHVPNDLQGRDWESLDDYTKDDYRLEAKAILEAALSAMWSTDMDAAPKDGTCILVEAERHGWEGSPRLVCVAWEPSGTGRWAIYGAGPSKYSEQWLDSVLPSRWAPLPKPGGETP
jgi:hypothetical protein